jgi:hypothetical protein
MSFEVKYLCSWWGSSHLGAAALLGKIAKAGYDGVEIAIPDTEAKCAELRMLLADHGLAVVAHQYAPPERNFERYCDVFARNLERSAAFAPLLINSHTGSDGWSFEHNAILVESAAAIAAASGIPILHETHRGRFLYSAPASAAYFERFPDLRITADLAHWTCVAESLLEDQESLVERALDRTDHLHARIGFAEGPQVLHPFSTMWSAELERFVGWWRAIVRRRRHAAHSGLTVTLEAGPVMAGDRTSAEPVPEFWEANLAMRAYLSAVVFACES